MHSTGSEIAESKALYHSEMASKYRNLARRSWLPFEPDPAEPE